MLELQKVSEMFVALLISMFCSNTSSKTMRTKVERTGDIERVCCQQIEKAHGKRGGKLTVGKKGVVHDENGHSVRAFAFEFGRFVVEGTLYVGWVVDMLAEEVHLLLIRSDVTSPMHTLFPDIGTALDWNILRKCATRFSPKSSINRHVVDTKQAQHDAVESAAANYLAQSGVFQQRDLEILQDMAPAKLHFIDLSASVALAHTFPAHLVPRLIHVLVTRNPDDLEEVRRDFKALDFSVSTQASGLCVPSFTVENQTDLNMWRKSSRFSYITYEKTQGIDYLYESMSQTLTLNEALFSTQFPYPPVVVGPSIWSNRNCVEIDLRGLRFSDEELLTGRKYIATLIKNQSVLMDKFSQVWQQSVATQEAALTPYDKLWFQSFHFAIGSTLFPASTALMDYLELTREADAARLRLRNDREQRYADAIVKLKSATSDAPWVYPSKPSTKEDALNLLDKQYDAFIHQKKDGPVLAFTKASLVRCASLERCELDDFVLKLKQNHLLEHTPHPVSFTNQEHHRFVCINAVSVTVTEEESYGDRD